MNRGGASPDATAALEAVFRDEFGRVVGALTRQLGDVCLAEPEAWGLVALMEIQASRLGARQGEDGQPVLLAADQRRSTGALD